MKFHPRLTALCLLPLRAFAGDALPLNCPQALEQIATLETTYPVYKQQGSDERHFIGDAERATEVARLRKIVAASCSTDAKARASEQAEADRLHVALSPTCAVARDTLTAMQGRHARESADTIETQRKLVTEKCPDIDTTNLWLLQWNGRGELQPDL